MARSWERTWSGWQEASGRERKSQPSVEFVFKLNQGLKIAGVNTPLLVGFLVPASWLCVRITCGDLKGCKCLAPLRGILSGRVADGIQTSVVGSVLRKQFCERL